MVKKSVFDELEAQHYPFQYRAQLQIDRLVGGIPNNEQVAEGWLKKKMAASNDAHLQELIITTMTERGVAKDEAAKWVENQLTVNGFKRDGDRGGQLYYEGRQLKAAVKEAVSVAIAADKLEQRGWGKTKKFLGGFLAEHVFIVEKRLYLTRPVLDVDGEWTDEFTPVTDPDGVMQQFVHTHNGDSIKKEEYVDDVVIDFTVIADFEFTREEWTALWIVGQHQGVGASRSQGYGTYRVTGWERIDTGHTKVPKAARGKQTAAEAKAEAAGPSQD